MTFLFGNEWVRRQIEQDGDVETGAGRIINSSADMARAIEEVEARSAAMPLRLRAPSAVRVDRSYQQSQMAAFSTKFQDEPQRLALIDQDSGLKAVVMLRAFSRTKLQVCWVNGATVVLRAGGHNPASQLLPVDGMWLDVDWGSVVIDDDDEFVSRAFELRPQEAGERSGDGKD